MDRLEALEAYVRIVELGSFTAAATDLGRRQATVSRWVAELEDDLQVQLLDRTTRSVGATAAGQRFYREARDVLDAWQSAVASARVEQSAVRGRIRVSVPVVFGARFITPLLPRLLATHPGLEVDVSFDDRYVDLVEAGVDLAVRVGRRVDSDYRARTLGVTPRRLVAGPGWSADHGPLTHPDDLADRACLVHSGVDPRVTWRFEHDGREATVRVGGRLRANHSETLRQLAVADQGVALLASWLVDDDIAAGRLVHLLPAWRPPEAPIQALFASTRHPPRRVRAFIGFLQEALAPALEAR